MTLTVRLEDVSYTYRGGRVALRPITTELRPGVVGLVGANGAGKSTLLRLLAGTLRATTGSVRYLIANQQDMALDPRRLGLMPQHLNLPASIRVQDFVEYVAWMKGVDRPSRNGEAKRVLARCGLADRTREPLGRLSGGMQRRVMLAQSLLNEPDLLLLDEPTAALDPEQRIAVRELIGENAEGRCVVVSSHTLEDLVQIADRVLMLDEGLLVFDGSIQDLLAIGKSRRSTGADSERNLSDYERAFLHLRERGQSI